VERGKGFSPNHTLVSSRVRKDHSLEFSVKDVVCESGGHRASGPQPGSAIYYLNDIGQTLQYPGSQLITCAMGTGRRRKEDICRGK
jgi:hypothetical protein